ncbi:MAG: hypothetical protein HUK17_06455 [Bacteroidales bacterium]|nr:hypothetical protein [Bacteroidales bacterium]
MIKLTKTYPAPAALETAGYKDASVKKRLRDDQRGKCCYCEQTRGGGFFDVEHYRPKKQCQQAKGMPIMDGYAWLENDWDNLLYCCNECNRSNKGSQFPLRDPNARDIDHQDISQEQPLLLNPYFDEVVEHLRFSEEFAVPAILPDGTESDKGRTTIKVLGLNDRIELLSKRQRVWRDYQKNVVRLQQIADASQGELGRELGQIVASNRERLLSNDSEFLGMLLNQQPCEY